MLDRALPDLTFPKAHYGPRQAPFDLRWLLYAGCSATRREKRDKHIAQGKLGPVIDARLPMAKAIHEHLNARLEKGGRQDTLTSSLTPLFQFYAHVDSLGESVTLATAQRQFVQWAMALPNRMKDASAYSQASQVAACLAPGLGMAAYVLAWKSNLRMPARLGTSAEKQNLERTKVFVQLLREVTKALPIEVVHGPLPVNLALAGKSYTMLCGLKKQADSDLTVSKPHDQASALAIRKSRSQNLSMYARSPLINLRIESELLLFLNQTAANLAQALQIRGTKFRYSSQKDAVTMRPWKGRADHAVEYQIHREYRAHFEAYLAWRNAMFPNDRDGLLFPFLSDDAGPNPLGHFKKLPTGKRPKPRSTWGFQATRKLCKELDTPYVSPRVLRATAGAWAERRKPGLGRVLLGNSPRTFARHYDRPDHQRALVEVTRFWRDTEAALDSPGPGPCVKADPQLLEDAPANAPKPDCASAGGCLFCEHHRDQHSFEHAWKLASLRSLYLRQLAADRSPDAESADHPLMLKINRIAAKLTAFQSLDAEHATWVVEADARVDEDNYHPYYASPFQVLDNHL